MYQKQPKSDKPLEISSKRPFNPLQSPKLKGDAFVSRDPRFDPLCGKLNEYLYQKAYSFVDELKEKEAEEYENKAKKAKNHTTKKELLKEAQRRKQQLDQKAKTERIRGKVREFRKTQRELVKKGVKPFYLRKSDITKLEVEDRMEQIQKKGLSVSKLLEKKRKHLASKQHTKIPMQRRDQGESYS